jgi:hypothetical protein
VLGTLNEQQYLAPRRPSSLLLARSSLLPKKPLARAIGYDIDVGISFLKSRKMEGGHRALGSP